MSNLSLDNLLCHAKETFRRKYADQWQLDLVFQPKLRTYRQIKHELGCENYVYATTKALEILHCSNKNRYLAAAD
ncbi:hypothetical protein DPMN_136489 [Dreissena polymorpha]|uniref:Uncharacterized protein n=1 Tax=Dreissena polymorpha TaxID=45954 RepID=A0A9D4G3P7_DREPO|nr:hypothetical protein DPMN_136489 [Dreissena polymorpha]